MISLKDFKKLEPLSNERFSLNNKELKEIKGGWPKIIATNKEWTTDKGDCCECDTEIEHIDTCIEF